MKEFMRKFTQLNGVVAKVILEHCLFDDQVFYCNELQTINDDNRIGVVLKNQEIFIDKQHISFAEVQGGTYVVSDGRLNIIVIVK